MTEMCIEHETLGGIYKEILLFVAMLAARKLSDKDCGRTFGKALWELLSEYPQSLFINLPNLELLVRREQFICER